MSIIPFSNPYDRMNCDITDKTVKLWYYFEHRIITHEIWDLNFTGLNYSDVWNNSMLDIICKHSDTYYLQKALAHYNWIHQTNAYTMDALSIACQYGNTSAIKIILQYQPNVKHVDCRNFNALAHHIYGYNPQLEIIKTLVQYGFALDHKVCDGKTLLHLVCIKNNLEVMRYLADFISIYIPDNYGNMALKYCNIHILGHPQLSAWFQQSWNHKIHRYLSPQIKDRVLTIVVLFQEVVPIELIHYILEQSIVISIL